jgi:hypothetical protein
MKTTSTRLGLVVLSLLMGGCATTQINHFKEFASAGDAYADAVVALTDEAGKVAIQADSLVLMNTRDSLSESERMKTVARQNKLLKSRIELLGDIRRHALLLKSYFAALSALAQSDAPSEIGKSATGVVDSLSAISTKIKNTEIGDAAIGEISGPVVSLVMTNVKGSALVAELKARGNFIAKELDLQTKALTVIAEQMKTDLGAVLLDQESTQVDEPFSSNRPLPEGWTKSRQTILTSHASLASAEAAVDASKTLRVAFVSLVENRFTLGDFESLMKDISQVVGLIEKIDSGATKTNS